MGNPYAHGDRIEQVVAWHAHHRPGGIALESGAHKITYGELTSQAAAIARTLSQRGIGPGNHVAIVAGRSVEMVYALLGVLYAGAAYAAIDPAWPIARIRSVLDQLDEIVLVDEPGRLTGLGQRNHLRIGSLLSLRQHEPGVASPDPRDIVAPGARAGENAPLSGTGAACVYFTSGSTGEPKGIVSPHRGTIRTVVANADLPLDTSTATLQAASLSWDAFSLELWGALLNGGTCVLLPAANLDPSAITAALRAGKVNTVWLTSSLLGALVDQALTELGRTRLIMTGGERVSIADARAVLQSHPHVQLVNGYGPGEATIFATTHTVTPTDVAPQRSELPIGRPIPHTEIAIADDRLELVAPDVTGEILISGHGLALGYLNNPDETRRRFITVNGPHGRQRFYRTGDLGLTDSSGVLWYRGRRDRQIKRRGVRIELQEIETIVERHHAVDRCVVEVLGQPTPEIVAFYTSHSTHSKPSAAELRAHAAQHLLNPMMPARFVHLPELPLTALGKVDHSLLQSDVSALPHA